jgi:hypothetical protein
VEHDPRIHMARAKIGDRAGHHEPGSLHFYKWYQNRLTGDATCDVARSLAASPFSMLSLGPRDWIVSLVIAMSTCLELP